ncbi:LysM peptidoglycan-binding domain-containing protein, partial [Macrococcoides canis]
EKAAEEKAAEEKAQDNASQSSSASNNSQSDNQQTQATHVVTAKENLYRIAIKYYGSGSPENVEKIRQANGISGNNLSQGQTLVIPK